MLAASNQGIASGFVTAPLETLSLMLPSWYPIPLLLSVGLSLLSGVAITLYSGGFSLQAAGVRVSRPLGVVIVAAVLGALTALLLLAFGGSITELFRDAATTIAVPIAAWAGIFASELMIRNRRFETMSLLHRGGIYADVRWGNLIALVVITVVGWAFTTASVGWLSWQGFGFSLLGIGADTDLAGTRPRRARGPGPGCPCPHRDRHPRHPSARVEQTCVPTRLGRAGAVPTVEDVLAVVEQLWPAGAEPWDAVGLVAGDPTMRVSSILLAVDAVLDTADEAVGTGAGLLIAHHPCCCAA